MRQDVLSIFRKVGAIREGHFLLSSGLHSPVYWEKFRVLQYPQYTRKLCRLIVQHFKEQRIDVVAGPATGGIILAFETARQLGVRCIFAEKEEGRRIFRRQFSIVPGEYVLVVDDIVTTGESIRQTIEAVDQIRGTVIGIGVLVDRSENGIDFKLPFFSCLRSPTVTYPPQRCPLCAAHIPLVRPGSL